MILVITAILWLTIISRDSVPEPGLQYKPFHSLKNLVYYTKLYGIRNNLIGNILLFIPIGILLPMVTQWSEKWYKTFFIGLFLSLFIESIQGATGRVILILMI